MSQGAKKLREETLANPLGRSAWGEELGSHARRGDDKRIFHMNASLKNVALDGL